MGLSEAEKALLAKLQKKSEEPDAPPIGKSVRATIDLGDEKQVALAIKHGFLTADEVEEMTGDGDGDGDKDEPTDERPKRRGYFDN